MNRTFHQGSTWGRTLRLSLNSSHSPLPPTPTPHFIVTSDHLANADHQGNAILAAPASVRRRAALERGLQTHFHDGYREGFYTLCVEVGFDKNGTLEADEPLDEATRLGRGKCRPRSGLDEVVDWEHEDVGLEMVRWEDDPYLRNFEENYFRAGGSPAADGFRR